MIIRVKKAFLGRTYVSMKEVRERSRPNVKAGRPPRSLVRRLGASLKAATKTDPLQRKLGGYAGAFVKHKQEEVKRRNAGKCRRKWQEIREERKGKMGGSETELPNDERCFGLLEASRILGVCVRTLVREIQRGRLRAFRVGRKWKIQLRELRRYMGELQPIESR